MYLVNWGTETLKNTLYYTRAVRYALCLLRWPDDHECCETRHVLYIIQVIDACHVPGGMAGLRAKFTAIYPMPVTRCVWSHRQKASSFIGRFPPKKVYDIRGIILNHYMSSHFKSSYYREKLGIARFDMVCMTHVARGRYRFKGIFIYLYRYYTSCL